jgi:hypothetical protein
VLFDYFNLYKTRLLIQLIDKMKVVVIVFFVLVFVDLSISFAVFELSQNLLDAINMMAQVCLEGGCHISYEVSLSISFFWILDHDVFC